MNNDELDKLLKSVPVPEKGAQYWNEFPSSVLRALRHASPTGTSRRENRSVPLLAWVSGLATVCVVIGLAVGFRWGRDSGPALQEQAELNKYFHEVEALFPNQVQAIVFDEAGTRLVLSDRPTVPSSLPVFVRICGKKGCHRFITFSGQRVQVNGDEFEILADAQGGVIVAGGRMAWSSAGQRTAKSPYRIEAKRLESLL